MHPTPLPSNTERLHSLDALRAFALLLGVALHAAMSYIPGAKFWWIVADTDPSASLGLAFHTIHLFRMTLFFLLAGFFARLALDRLGVRRFLLDRCKRIAVPLVMFWPLVMTGIVLAIVWSVSLANGGALPAETPPGPTFMPDDFPLAHLWFLYVLLLFYVGALLLRAAVARFDRNGIFVSITDRMAKMLFGPSGAWVLAIPVSVALATHTGWRPWFGIPTPDQSLYPNLPSLVAYGVAFTAGWLLQRQRGLLDGLQRQWPIHAAIALGTSLALGVMGGVLPDYSMASGRAQDWLHAACYGVASWSWTLALLGLGLRCFSRYSATRRYLADASYWMYLVHLPLVMLLQVAASRMTWPWFVEYPLLLAMAVGIMLASYALLVRHTWLGALLNGRKLPWRRPGTAPNHASA